MTQISESASQLAATQVSRAPDGVVRRRQEKMLFMGLFPPPVDGQRIVTQCMLERFDAATTVASYSIDRFPRFGRLSKPLSAVAACFSMVVWRVRGCSMLYLAPHSGAGLIYSWLIAVTSRCCGYALTVHYHSYRNMGRHSWLMARFLSACGPEAIHVVLAPPMARDLQHLYRQVRRVAVVSNAIIVTPRPVSQRSGARRLRIGHLSNLSREKGIGTVLQCMRALGARGVDAELWIAGPAEDADTSALITGAQAEFGNRLNYLGRLAPSEVPHFYADIDIFLFPTFYEHEAEPLVIIDAISAGVPVIATNRGCISYMLGTDAGCVLPAWRFVERAVEQIALWAGDRRKLSDASRRAQARFMKLHQESRIHLDQLFATIFDR
jgi:glycosyltransferase involved in cell wall biosynthesis